MLSKRRYDNDIISEKYICALVFRVITDSSNDLSPIRPKTPTWTNDYLLSIVPLARNFTEVPIKIQTLSFNKMYLKMSSTIWLPFCLDPMLSIRHHLGRYLRWHFCSISIMMTSSNGNIFRVTGPLCGEFTGPGEFPAQRPVTRSFDVFFDLRLNRRFFIFKAIRGFISRKHII